MVETSINRRGPNVVDVHVGGRIRLRRKLRGISQEQLAKALGLTFQQVQKYERGSNRVSASKLYEISRTLEVSTSYFFEDLEGSADEIIQDERGESLRAFLLTSEGLELMQLLPRIQSGRLRRQVLELARALVDSAV